MRCDVTFVFARQQVECGALLPCPDHGPRAGGYVQTTIDGADEPYEYEPVHQQEAQ